MKRIMLALAVLATAIGCGKSDNESDVLQKRKDIPLTRTEQEILTSGGDFAFNLMHEAYKSEERLFLSPLSAQTALMMVANGASGQTYGQIAKVIGYDGYSIDDINTTYGKIVEGLKTVDTSTDLEMANSIWTAKGMSVKDDFRKVLKNIYDAEAGDVNFTEQSDVDKINIWCNDKTHGMIPTILNGPSTFESLILNALYFKGQWSSKFDPKATAADGFKVLSGKKVQMDFMHQANKFKYTVNDEFQFCELPYGNGAYCLDILLPKEDVDFSGFIDGLDYEKFQGCLAKRETANVILSVPKMKFEFSMSLKNVLMNMGMKTPFTSEADFTDISDSGLMISEVRQKTAFEMNEEGAKAAAVTSVGMDNSAGPSDYKTVTFKADRPFVFVIREISTNAILFIGTCTGKE